MRDVTVTACLVQSHSVENMRPRSPVTHAKPQRKWGTRRGPGRSAGSLSLLCVSPLQVTACCW